MGLLFDAGDRELLRMLDALGEGVQGGKALRRSLSPFLHPHGIEELAAPRELRMAFAMLSLLKSLDEGTAQVRLQALRRVHEEALASERGSLKRNTARVLLQTMKELVRCKEPERRLELAHEFRLASNGAPRLIRSLLSARKLLEMPEEWNQIAFDDHVHDAHTKGRKTSTHLVMDAWIKGLRSMTVIYYSAVGSEAARELLEAGAIMDVEVKIGVELPVAMSRRRGHLIWIPRGFNDATEFLKFLDKEPVHRFMELGEEMNKAASIKVFDALTQFNADGRLRLSQRYGVEMPELARSDFEGFVANAPATRAHLAEFAHERILPLLGKGKPSAALLEDMDSLDAERISQEFLPDAARFRPEPPWNGPEDLLERLRALPSGFRMTLNMSGLDFNDTLEALWRCKGAITHLEAFNLKDYLAGEQRQDKALDELRHALNSGNAIRLKGIIRKALESNPSCPFLNEMLHKLPELSALYKNSHLGVRIGSDSTERSRSLHGMGFAIPETLPNYRSDAALAAPLPLRLPVRRRVITIPQEGRGKFLNWGRPGRRETDFAPIHKQFRHAEPGNIVALGSMATSPGNGLLPQAEDRSPLRLLKLNSGVLNGLKILLGFIPAFLTFLLTKDWWLLAYFGAFIWFGITGLRNVLMSVIGGGGVFRSPLLPWRRLVDWNRLADSLMYTGFSVPLLDLLVKTVILDKGLGMTVSNAPVAVYAAMALANGAYLSTHNYFRGFPKPVVAGNFFRSILSIPIAWCINFAALLILGAFSIPDPAGALQKWAAIISKAASDCVAGLIEGAGDRFRNIRLRLDDYRKKREQLFELCARIETLFPELELSSLLKEQGGLHAKLKEHDRNAWRELVIHSLDLLHIYWRKPRAQAALSITLASMKREERSLFIETQLAALDRAEEVAKLITEGLGAGKDSAPMKLYRDYAPGYCEHLRTLR